MMSRMILTGTEGRVPMFARFVLMIALVFAPTPDHRLYPRVFRAESASGQSGTTRGPCTNRDLEGAFAFFGTGTILAPPAPGLGGPFGRVGRFVSDGAGNVAFNSRANFNGTQFHQDFAGTYGLNPDCTGFVRVTLPFNLPPVPPFSLVATFHGVVADQGRTMQDLLVDPAGQMIYGRARKQLIARCTDRDLSGPYRIDLSGSTLDLGFPLPFSSVGRIETDGRGRVEGRVDSNRGGFSVAASLSGTYAVASDCTFQLTYCVFGPDGRNCQLSYAIHGVFVDEGEAAFLIATEPTAAVLIGELRRQ